ncbi:MAG: polysaccharide deacetylase family protein [Nitrospira sp.]|nr:polysaccharide deacetylase family protein [Nitrospira sp.]
MGSSISRLKSATRTSIAWAAHACSLHQLRLRGKVAILMYHRVLTCEEVACQAVQPGMYVLDTVFAQQMAFLRKTFTVLSFRQLLDLWQADKWDERARYCVITFDDGWLDNYRHAYPVLKRLELPATIFLPTDYVGTNQWFWPDQIAYLLKSARSEEQGIKDFQRIERVLLNLFGAAGGTLGRALANDERVADQLIDWCKELPKDRIQTLVSALAEELGVSLPVGRVVVNWDEVREMSQGGISFGSHSCSHRIMTTILPSEVSQELEKSEHVLQRAGIDYVPVFCYPNGNSDTAIQAQAKAHGYEAAVSVQMGVEGTQPSNRFALRRVGIHNDVTYSIPLFSLRLCGLLSRTT